MTKMTDPPELRAEVGRRMAELRTWTGLTQKDFALRANLDPQSISKIERGRQALSLPTIRGVAKAFGVSIDWLVAAHADASLPAGDAGKLRAATMEAIDRYLASMPPERSVHPETAERLRAVAFRELVDDVPTWDDIHDVLSVLVRHQRRRA